MKPDSRGAAQSTLVVGISVVTLLVLAVFIIVFITRKIDQRELDKGQSQLIAEAGLTQALEKINANPSWIDGFLNVKYREGVYSVAIEKVSDSVFKAISTGINNGAKTVIVCTYKLEKTDNTIKPRQLSMELQ